jgi:hypothetical protein
VISPGGTYLRRVPQQPISQAGGGKSCLLNRLVGFRIPFANSKGIDLLLHQKKIKVLVLYPKNTL